MYPPGHVGLTALLFAPVVCWFRLRGRREAARECLQVGVALSLLPDADKLLPGLVHRGITHTLLAAVVAGALVAVGFRLARPHSPGLGGESTVVCYLVGVAGVVSHLVGDIITPMGIRLLFPGSRTVYSLDVVRASSPTANMLLVVGGTAALLCTYSVSASGPTVDETTADESAAGRALSSRR